MKLAPDRFRSPVARRMERASHAARISLQPLNRNDRMRQRELLTQTSTLAECLFSTNCRN